MKSVIVFLSCCFYICSCNSVSYTDDRIVGGIIVDISEFPYQVSVRIYDDHICGGSILNELTILTAAHCVYGFDHTQYSVRVGSSINGLGVKHIVSKITMNENYNPSTTDNDMAILKLETPIVFGPTAQPIQLQPEDIQVPSGTIAWVSGWGVTREGFKNISFFLRATPVTVISMTQCNLQYHGDITYNMLCADAPGHDACQGDSGGPLVANGRLIGVVSWGYGCARPLYPGVYANVTAMYNWIVSHT